MSTAVGRLVRTELKLMRRDPLMLTFVFVFPIVTMLIIGGSFGTEPDPAFDGTNPSHWYVASYLTVVIAATGLIMVPVHLASYRERGVLRRFAAAGFPRWSFALAQLVVGLVTIIVAARSCSRSLRRSTASRRCTTSRRVHHRARARRGRLRRDRCAARHAAAVGPRGPGRRPDPLLPVLPARRRWTAAACHGRSASSTSLATCR